MLSTLLHVRHIRVLLGTTLFALNSISIANAATVVSSSALDHIVILPNDRPTVVDVDTDMQFVATGYTADEQVIPSLTFTWSVVGGIGRSTKEGIFTGERGGIGGVAARSGNVTATVGVVVRGVKKNSATALDTNTAIPPAKTTVTPTNANTKSAPDGEEKGTINTNTPTVTQETAEHTTTACTMIRGWIWALIMIVYCILLVIYFFALGDSRTPWWWIWPALLTAELLILYFSVRCDRFQQWVPLITIVLGTLLSFFYYRLLRPKDLFASPPNLHQP